MIAKVRTWSFSLLLYLVWILSIKWHQFVPVMFSLSFLYLLSAISCWVNAKLCKSIIGLYWASRSVLHNQYMLQFKLLFSTHDWRSFSLFTLPVYSSKQSCVLIHIGVPYRKAKLQGTFCLFFPFARFVLILTSPMDSLFCQMIEKLYWHLYLHCL